MKKNKMFNKISAILLSAVLAFSAFGVSVSAAERTPAGYIEYNMEFMQKYGDAVERFAEGMLNYEKQIVLSSYNVPSDKISELLDAALRTYPELFYVNRISYYMSSGNISSILPEYAYSKEEVQTMLDEFYTSADYYLSKVNDNMSDFEKALILHDELVINTHYHINGSSSYTEMVQGFGKCHDYAMVYAYLLAQVGIKSEYVSSNAMNHAWLKICIDGEYYNVDVTWDDPASDTDGDGYYEERIGKVRHSYFLLSDEAFQTTNTIHHSYDSYYSTSTKYDNFSMLHDVRTQFCYIDGEFYAIEQSTGNLVKYNFTNDSSTTLKKISDRWKSDGNRYWVGNFSSLAEYDGLLYYNSPDAVYSYNPIDGTTELLAKNTYENELYGLRLMDGKIYGVVAENPNVMGRLEYLCDLPEKKILVGDVNEDGVINITDATAIQVYLAEVSDLTDSQLKAADMNGDGEINIIDATEIQIYIVNN